MSRTAIDPVMLLVLCACAVAQGPEEPCFTCYGEGPGPSVEKGVVRLLVPDQQGQRNIVAWPREAEGAREHIELTGQLRVLEGGEGGGIAFLSTRDFGAWGPGPYLADWVAPDLAGSFAVGIDVSNPRDEEPFSPFGNYRGMPEREISLHWDGREIVKRMAAQEFRGEFHEVQVLLRFVTGGAEATVRIGSERIYDGYFLPGVLPYEARLAIGARTSDPGGEFEVKELDVGLGATARDTPRPMHVDVFNHVLTNNSQTRFEVEASLPPAGWAYGRVILNLDIHDAGDDWDEWDRNGDVSVWDTDGVEHVIVPFITSYRTECKWSVDVTHFRPLLAGNVKIAVAAGTTFYKNRGYMMSLSLDFYPGAPSLVPHRVVPLWSGSARYKSDESPFADLFDRRVVAIDERVAAARVFVTTTGHTQIGEFTPAERTIVFAPDATAPEGLVEFTNRLWRDDCYLNPNRPQFGTWKYSRAGWAPGDIVRPWWIDLTPHVVVGQEAALEYVPSPYDFSGHRQPPAPGNVHSAQHVVRSYLILYREPTGLIAPPALVVSGVVDGSAAGAAGVKAGDYLASYNGQELQSIEDLRAAIAGAVEAEAGLVEIVLFRDGARMSIEMPAGRMGVNLRGP